MELPLTVNNYGGLEGEISIPIYLDKELVETEKVILGPYSQQTHIIQISNSDSINEVLIKDHGVYLTQLSEEPTVTEPTVDDPAENMYLILVGIIVAIVIIVILFKQRKQS